MAFVVKDSKGRSPFWIACFVDSSGRRLKKSTKLTNKKKALEVALSLEHGEHLARTGAFTEARLRDLLEQTLERVVGSTVRHYTAEAWLHWWHERKAKARPASAERYGQVVRDFLGSLGPRAKLPLEHISDKDILVFRSAETRRGVSNKTANLAIKIISMPFTDAVRQGRIKFNPCLGLDPLDEESAEREPFTPDEVRKLFGSATGDWQRAIMFSYYTGARLSDVASMLSQAIDWEKRLISFIPKKTKRGKKVLRIPLHPELEKQLLKNAGVGNAPLFPELAGRRTGGAHGLSAEFAAIMRKAGVYGKIVRHTANGRRNTTKSFHSLRHNFVSALADGGIAREVRQVLAGHASERMNELYTHRELETVRNAISVIPAI
jgi:integrase